MGKKNNKDKAKVLKVKGKTILNLKAGPMKDRRKKRQGNRSQNKEKDIKDRLK